MLNTFLKHFVPLPENSSPPLVSQAGCGSTYVTHKIRWFTFYNRTKSKHQLQ